MKSMYPTWLSIAVLLLGMLSDASAAPPNLLFVFADDMSYEALGAADMLDVETPNLDRLAKQGTRFTHAYNMGSWSGAVCVASRTMLNTGRFVWDAKSTNLNDYVAGRRMWSQRMSDAGYRTYMSGKWHVGTSAQPLFNVTGNVRGGMPEQTQAGYKRPLDQDDYDHGWKPWDRRHGGFWAGGKHWSEVLGDEGVEFLSAAAKEDQPFFMYLAFNAPHDPRQSPKEYVDRYPLDRIATPENMLSEYPYLEAACGRIRDENLAPFPRTQYAVKVNRQEYFAIITHMDDQIGRILAALDSSGKADDTYIFFTADHGLAVGHHGLMGKQNMYDHSVRVPFIISGPNVSPGSVISTPIYLQDVMPTCLELAGMVEPEAVDFKSLMPLLREETSSHYDQIYGGYLERQRMITHDGWKLIHYPTIGISRLFDLTSDPNEMNDLASRPKYAAKRKTLATRLASMMGELNDPLADVPPVLSTDDANHRPTSKP